MGALMPRACGLLLVLTTWPATVWLTLLMVSCYLLPLPSWCRQALPCHCPSLEFAKSLNFMDKSVSNQPFQFTFLIFDGQFSALTCLGLGSLWLHSAIPVP